MKMQLSFMFLASMLLLIFPLVSFADIVDVPDTVFHGANYALPVGIIILVVILVLITRALIRRQKK